MDGMTFLSSFRVFFTLNLFIRLAKNSQGFTLELMHPFSPESPFRESNITYTEMIKVVNFQPRNHGISPATVSYNANFDNINIVRPVLDYATWGYLIKLNIGFFPHEQPTYKTYYLHFDTSSHIIWLQCEECDRSEGHCFNQLGTPYPNRMSKSYHPLACDVHRLCFPHECLEHYCSYDVQYRTGESSFGVLAYETFHFDVAHLDQPKTARIVVGCGIKNIYDTYDGNSKLAGVLGMNWSPHSFVNQITSHSQGRFSYCLPPLIHDGDERSSTVLRFGSDIHALDGLRSLPILKDTKADNYYVTLEGISINNMRVNIPFRYFKKIGPGNGGCIFSTGTLYTILPRRAFKILKSNMIKYLARVDGSLKKQRGTRGFNLCYRRYRPFKWYDNLPTVTFHFEGGGDLVVRHNTAFIVWRRRNKEYVCLAIMPASKNDIAVIGTQYQSNHVVVYDLPSKMMYFGPRSCALQP